MTTSDGSDEADDASGIVRSIMRPALFVEVSERHGDAVHAYLARRAGRQSADDLAAEVWLAAFGSRARYDLRRSNARPWLYGIAHNILRASWRKRSLLLAVDQADDPWDLVVARLDAVDQRGVLRSALARLPDDDREVLLLTAWEELTPAEISVVLAMPAGTVRWRLHRARRTLATMPELLSASRHCLPTGEA